LEYTEKRISGEEVYHGVIVDVFLDRAELINGSVVKREVVDHPGGVGILPVDENNNCYLVRQFRYPFQREMLEIPAGKLERGEEHYSCAVRELSEETGFTADEYIYCGETCTSPGFSTEVLHVYIAKGLHYGNAHPDDDEFLNVEKYHLSELLNMVKRNEIKDAKTIIAILMASEALL